MKNLKREPYSSKKLIDFLSKKLSMSYLFRIFAIESIDGYGICTIKI